MSKAYNAARLQSVDRECLDSLCMGEAPTRAYRDVDTVNRDSWVVMIWDNHRCSAVGTPWDGITKVSVKHTAASNQAEFLSRDYSLPVTWDDLQAIKDRFWPGLIGLEIYPPKRSIVNAADLRWLWVLPAAAVLPFNLQAGVPILKGGDDA